ncbi:MAG: hypothetical protein KBA05_07660 [Anaerolineaceae bacterium]|jgi:hypothetical protein|nr:hypothetical protein [Anaerolineaceae bacterium]MDI9531669.1 hypothetical protein [Chloroflexota bacterium]
MKKYDSDYKTILSINKKGEQVRTYEYQGDYYKLPFDSAQMRKFKILFMLTLAGVILAHILGGVINNPGMRNFYVAIPYAFAALPIFNLFRSGIRLPIEDRKYRREEIGVTYERFTNHSLFLLIALGACILGEVVYLVFFSKGGAGANETYFLAAESAALALGLVIYISLKKVVITKVPEEEKTSVAAEAA